MKDIAITAIALAAILLSASCRDSQEKRAGLPPGAIPFTYDSLIRIQGTIGEHNDCNLIFGTGTSDLCIDMDYYIRHAAGIGMESKVYKAFFLDSDSSLQSLWLIQDTTISLDLGAARISCRGAAVLDLGSVSDGILGLGGLTGSPIEINFGRSYLRRITPEETDTTGGYTEVPIGIDEAGRLTAEMEMTVRDRTVRGIFILDTGKSGDVELSPAFAERQGIHSLYEAGKNMSPDTATAVIGKDTVRGITVRWPAAATEAGETGNTGYAGSIGCGILSAFDIIIDFSDSTMYLKPHGKNPAAGS